MRFDSFEELKAHFEPAHSDPQRSMERHHLYTDFMSSLRHNTIVLSPASQQNAFAAAPLEYAL